MPLTYVCDVLSAQARKEKIMKGRKRLSPFEELMRFIEQLEVENKFTVLYGKNVNHDFVLGFTTAINSIYTMGITIYNRSIKASDFTAIDITDPEMIAKLKKG